jgi:hypothetical protein
MIVYIRCGIVFSFVIISVVFTSHPQSAGAATRWRGGKTFVDKRNEFKNGVTSLLDQNGSRMVDHCGRTKGVGSSVEHCEVTTLSYPPRHE